MSKYTEEQLQSFFEDVTRYIEEAYDKKLVLNTRIGPALAASFRSVDDFTGFIITVVNDKATRNIDVHVSTATCIDYARNNPDFTDGMPAGNLADSIAFTGLALALLDEGVTTIEYPAVRNAVLDQVLPLVTPVDQDQDGAQTLRCILLELLKDLEEGK